MAVITFSQGDSKRPIAPIKLKGNTITVTGKIEKLRPINVESGWVLYLRRKDKLYFNSVFGKRTLTLSPMPPEMATLKYGSKVRVGWNAVTCKSSH